MYDMFEDELDVVIKENKQAIENLKIKYGDKFSKTINLLPFSAGRNITADVLKIIVDLEKSLEQADAYIQGNTENE